MQLCRRAVVLVTVGSVLGGLVLLDDAGAQGRRRKKGAPAGPVIPAGSAAPTVADEEPPPRSKVAKDPELDGLLQKTMAPMQSPLGDVRYILDEIGADLPDPTPVSKGGPVLRKRPKGPKKPAPAAAKKPPGEPDWIVQLKELTLTEPALVSARDETIARIELIRQIGAKKSSAAAEGLLEVAFAHDGVLRDECGRNIRAIGGEALPRLIYRGQKDANWKVRRYANYQLDRMDRAVPAKALAQRDDRLRAEILFAYGDTRHPDAVRSVLGQTDAMSHRVRTMARWAFKRYLTGPRPRVRKRKLKLPGGKESKKEHIWLSYRDIAVIAVKEALAQAQNVDFDPKVANADPTPPIEVAKKLFDVYDQRRASLWDEAYKKGEAKLKAGDAKAAIVEFDTILANDPYHAKRKEMAPAYLAAGTAVGSATPESRKEALLLLRKARLLDPKGDTAQKAALAILRIEEPGASPKPDATDPQTPGTVDAPPVNGSSRTKGILYAVGAILGLLVVISGIGVVRKRG